MGRRPTRTVTLWQHSDLPPRPPDYEYAWDTGKTNPMMRGRPAGAEGLWPVSMSFGDLFSAAKHPVRKPAWLGAHFALTLADLGGGSHPALPLSASRIVLPSSQTPA